jgi:hypothetical protein
LKVYILEFIAYSIYLDIYLSCPNVSIPMQKDFYTVSNTTYYIIGGLFYNYFNFSSEFLAYTSKFFFS